MTIATSPLGIIAGSTELPHAIARAAEASGRGAHVICIEGSADETLLDPNHSHDWVRIGAIGQAFKSLKKQGVKDVIFAGKVSRPPLAGLRPDLKGAKLLAKLGSTLLSKDDDLLRAIVGFFEEEGMRVVSIDEACPDMVTPNGLLTGDGDMATLQPALQEDIAFGLPLAKQISRLDIGQSIIVQEKQVLGIEAIEGTDGLIKRCADYKLSTQGGVLIKVKKPHQERRMDLPTMGVATVETIAEAGFSAIAIEAGHSIMIDREAIIARANALNIHLIGVEAAHLDDAE